MRQCHSAVALKLQRANAAQAQARRRPNLRADVQGTFLQNLLTDLEDGSRSTSQFLERAETVLKPMERLVMSVSIASGWVIPPG